MRQRTPEGNNECRVPEIFSQFLNAAFVSGDLEKAAGLLVDDVTIHLLGQTHHGIDAWMRSTGPAIRAFSDLCLARDVMLVDGELIAIRWTLAGKHTGEYRGIAPTGRQVEWCSTPVPSLPGS